MSTRSFKKKAPVCGHVWHLGVDRNQPKDSKSSVRVTTCSVARLVCHQQIIHVVRELPALGAEGCMYLAYDLSVCTAGLCNTKWQHILLKRDPFKLHAKVAPVHESYTDVVVARLGF